jgi:hypothetical protein
LIGLGVVSGQLRCRAWQVRVKFIPGSADLTFLTFSARIQGAELAIWFCA